MWPQGKKEKDFQELQVISNLFNKECIGCGGRDDIWFYGNKPCDPEKCQHKIKWTFDDISDNVREYCFVGNDGNTVCFACWKNIKAFKEYRGDSEEQEEDDDNDASGG